MTLALSSFVSGAADRLLLGRLDADHMLDGEMASSKSASSPCVIAPVRTSNGFVSLAYVLNVKEESTSGIRSSSADAVNSNGRLNIVAAFF